MQVSSRNSKELAIVRASQSPAADPHVLALGALGWLLGDTDRGQRFLSLTGLRPDALREGLCDPAVLAAVLDFLAANEPDLVAAAQSLDVTPQELSGAGEMLKR